MTNHRRNPNRGAEPHRNETSKSKSGGGGVRLNAQLVNFVMIALTIAAGYFMTIQSLKLELAGKAENVTVETLDKKLGNLEVLFREGTISKEEFFRFSREVENRLARIEYHLSSNTGEHTNGK